MNAQIAAINRLKAQAAIAGAIAETAIEILDKGRTMGEWAVTPHGEYPPEWTRGMIQQDIYHAAGWRCEHCGMEFVPGSTLAKTARNAKGDPIILTVHHIDGDKGNCSYQNLVALCQICHLKMHHLWSPGMVLPLEWHNQIPAWIQRRGLAYRVNPQLELFSGEWD